MDIINMRSDTQTLPTPAMLEAIVHAQLGDDTYGEDPTVKEFETLAAEMVGMEAAMLVLSGNMGNLVSLMAHGNPGDEVIIDQDSHIFYVSTRPPRHIRMCTNLHHDDATIDEVLTRVSQLMQIEPIGA